MRRVPLRGRPVLGPEGEAMTDTLCDTECLTHRTNCTIIVASDDPVIAADISGPHYRHICQPRDDYFHLYATEPPREEPPSPSTSQTTLSERL